MSPSLIDHTYTRLFNLQEPEKKRREEKAEEEEEKEKETREKRKEKCMYQSIMILIR